MRAVFALMIAAGTMAAGASAEPNVSISAVSIANLPLGVVTFPNGKAMNLTVGIGSGAFRHPADPEGRVWLLTDRGPTITCAEAKDLIGMDEGALCGGNRRGRVHPLPGFAPSIYAADIGLDNVARINVFLPLRGPSGRPVTGLPNPWRQGDGDSAHTVDGKTLPNDPAGIDPEALVRLSDGSFIVAEEYGPSLLRIQPDGTIVQRIVPEGTAEDLKDAGYPVVGGLPGILRRRATSRGLEALAVSPDEKVLYAVMQGPLANPDEGVLRVSSNTRILKIDLATGAVLAEYLYRLDEAGSFRGDNGRMARDQHDVRISEVAAVGPDRLIVLERINRTAKFYRIDLSTSLPLPPRFDDEKTVPSLEQLGATELEANGIIPVEKTLVLDTDDVKGMPPRIEAIAVLSPREMIVVNDNDFAIDGAKTQMFRVRFGEPVLQ